MGRSTGRLISHNLCFFDFIRNKKRWLRTLLPACNSQQGVLKSYAVEHFPGPYGQTVQAICLSGVVPAELWQSGASVASGWILSSAFPAAAVIDRVSHSLERPPNCSFTERRASCKVYLKSKNQLL